MKTSSLLTHFDKLLIIALLIVLIVFSFFAPLKEKRLSPVTGKYEVVELSSGYYLIFNTESGKFESTVKCHGSAKGLVQTISNLPADETK